MSVDRSPGDARPDHMTRIFSLEFHISKTGSFPEPGTIEATIRAVDPSALVDIDPSGRTLRVATSVDAAELVALMGQAGCPVTLDQVTQVPSICCGGCSG